MRIPFAPNLTESASVPRPARPPRGTRAGFTLLEIMIALGLFLMIMTGVYATWSALLKGGDAAKRAAADVQRSRIAIRTLQDAFITAVMFTGNIRDYAFLADTSGDMAAVSMVARLPASFPGVGHYGDQVVRRISFVTQAGKRGGTELVMTQAPLLLDTNGGPQAYSLVLANDVTFFKLSFYDALKNEWIEEWKYTNSMPKLVQVGLGLGTLKNSGKPADIVTTIISIPSNAVSPDIQGGTVANRNNPPVNLPPGAIPGGAPGGFPGGAPGGFPGGIPR